MPVYQERQPNVDGNAALRIPQREAYAALTVAAAEPDDRELGVVLPVGCGKSGLLSITPQAVSMRFQRALARLRERLPESVFEELADLEASA